ncbi:hypothetical protein ZWY2020_020701 [Hordeum vulgare]|nr:hypothetical protein ZWY2020_020701 [Hordeum vulgare]
MGLDLNEAYESPGSGKAAVGSPIRRTLMFEDSAHNLFDTGPQASFGTQDGGGSAVVDEERDIDNADEEEEDVEADDGKKKKKGGCRGIAWTAKEDECLIESWSSITQDVITGSNQTSDSYWKRILFEFDECKYQAPYIQVVMDRNQSALAHRWATIQKSVNKFQGAFENITARPESGKTVKDQLVDALKLYKTLYEKDFVLLHCFNKLQKNEKWKKHRL